MYFATIQSKRNRFHRRVSRLLKDAFNQQLLSAIESNALLPLPSPEKVSVSDQLIVSALEKAYTDVGVHFAKFAYNQIQKKYGQTQKALNPVLGWAANILAQLKGSIQSKAAYISASVRSKISSLLTKHQDKPLDIARTKIRREFNAFATVRASILATLEIVSASNIGLWVGAKSSNIPLKKVWYATRDQKTRIDHLTADGQAVGLDASFRIGGEYMRYPGDPSATLANTANCRCSMFFRS